MKGEYFRERLSNRLRQAAKDIDLCIDNLKEPFEKNFDSKASRESRLILQDEVEEIVTYLQGEAKALREANKKIYDRVWVSLYESEDSDDDWVLCDAE